MTPRALLRPICWLQRHRPYSRKVNEDFWKKNRDLFGPDVVGGVLVERDYCLRCGKEIPLLRLRAYGA